MTDSITDFIAELQEAHRMHADGSTEHGSRLDHNILSNVEIC